MSNAVNFILASGERGFDYWISTLSGDTPLTGTSVSTNSEGDVIISGFVQRSGVLLYDALVARVSPTGVFQWARVLDGPSSTFRSVAVDSSDNIVAVGGIEGGVSRQRDGLVAKYSASGLLLWVRQIGSSRNDGLLSVVVDGSDNIICCGFANFLISGSVYSEAYIAKYDSDGTLQWQRFLGDTSTSGSNNDEATGVFVDGSDNIIVCGFTRSDGAGDADAFIAKYDSSGSLQWQRTLGGVDVDVADDVVVDGADNIIVCGYTDSEGAGGRDAFIAKYNSSGVIQWQRTLGGSGTDSASYVATDSSNNIIVCGDTDSDGAGGQDSFMAKYNSSGALQWQRTLGGSGTDDWDGVVVDGSGDLVFIGTTTSTVSSSSDIFLSKLPSDGSGTGTYSVFTYEESTLTDSASTLTDAASSLSATTGTLTQVTASVTNEDKPLSSDLIKVSP